MDRDRDSRQSRDGVHTGSRENTDGGEATEHGWIDKHNSSEHLQKLPHGFGKQRDLEMSLKSTYDNHRNHRGKTLVY